MALRIASTSRVPLIVIMGATGTGKTKLSIELARKYGAEIISSDSMQIYKGLDIITAKATAEERNMAPHHLLDILEPHHKYCVVDFRNRALNIIDDLMSKSTIPIVVGGTNYYMESILWRILVQDGDSNDTDTLLYERDEQRRVKRIKSDAGSAPETKDQERDWEDEDYGDSSALPNEILHNKLKEVDPPMAERLHPNNRRKVLRALQVWFRTGRRHSDILQEQKDDESKLRYPDNTIVFWLVCNQTVHDERLNARVDSMIDEGLLEELYTFHNKYNKNRIQDGQEVDYTKGVFQTIGFKEFHSYLMLNEEEREMENGQKLFREGVENLKMATRRYARKQMKMVNSRMLHHPRRQIPPIFDLDTTDPSQWDIVVRDKAMDLIESFLKNEPFNIEPLKSKILDTHAFDMNVTRRCELCDRLFVGDFQFKIHMNSYRHKRTLAKLNAKKEEASGEPKADGETEASVSEKEGSSSI